jgi:hypothetical protein
MLLSLFILAQSIEGPPVPDVQIQVGITEIAAVVAALLIIARVIVKFTKTKKDDAAVEKITGWFKVLKVVTGLDLRKGIDKYGPK